MNITMDELSLKKVKFGAEPASTTVEAPASAESNPEKGMNALTFMGMRNLMSNPRLAQEVGVPAEEPKSEPNADAKSYVAPYSSNIAFQGGKAKTLSMAAVIAGSALGLGSCTKEYHYDVPDPTPREIVVNVSQTVNVDLSALCNLVSQLINKDDAHWNQLFQQLEYLAQLQKDQKDQDAAFQNLVISLLSDNKDLLAELIQIANHGNVNMNRILAYLDKIYNSNLSANEQLALIKALITDIKDLVAQSVKLQKQAELDRQALLAELQKSNATQSQILTYAIKSYESEQELINQNKMILAKLDLIDVDMNANAQALAQQLGMTFAELKELIRHIANGVDISNFQAGTIIQLLRDGNKQSEEINNKLYEIIQKLNNGNLSAEELRELLNQMNSLLASIDARLADLTNKIKQYLPELASKLDQIVNNQNTHTELLTMIFDAIGSLLDNGISKEDIATIINLLNQQNVDLEKLMRIVCALNQNVTEGRAENRQFAETIIQVLNKYGNGIMDDLAIIIEKMNALGNDNAGIRDLLQKFFDAYLNNSEMTKAQLKAILDAIANIHIEQQEIDLSGFEAMLNQIIELLKTNNNWLSSIDAKIALINTSQNIIISKLDDLAGKIPNYTQDLNEIKALLEALKNKPGYDDAAVVAKLNEIIEILLTHEFCHCNCSGSGDGNHEGIIGDILTCLNS